MHIENGNICHNQTTSMPTVPAAECCLSPEKRGKPSLKGPAVTVVNAKVIIILVFRKFLQGLQHFGDRIEAVYLRSILSWETPCRKAEGRSVSVLDPALKRGMRKSFPLITRVALAALIIIICHWYRGRGGRTLLHIALID